MNLKTFADVKRAMIPGRVIQVHDHLVTRASGRRTVIQAISDGYWYSTDKYPRSRDDYPKTAKSVRIDGPNVVTFLDKKGRDSVTITFEGSSSI